MFAASVVLLAGLVIEAEAQIPTPGDSLSPTRPRNDRALTGQSGPLLDRPVERSEYRLGPGDVVDVAVFGEVELLSTVPVTPEGTIVVPGIGVARVLGLNLDQAQARVRDLVSRLYRNVDVTLALAQVRTFKVFVVGDVPSPGVQAATSVTRVSEVLPSRRSGGLLYRNVLLRRPSGDSTQVDLARFALLGDLSSNPTLREGDALVVRSVEETVDVVGRVGSPGRLEYRAGETLAELLLLTNGGRGLPASAADTVRVSRIGAGGARQILTFTAAEAQGPRGAAFMLRPFDAVYVAERANFGVQPSATVRGQVARPGTYPIRPDTTTVRDLVALAGGFTPQASLVGATLQRTVPAGSRARPQDAATPNEALTPREREIRAIEARAETNFVVIDFQRLFANGDDAYNQPLRRDDVLTVPERQYDVAVLGAVVRPGLVAYTPERSVDQYVYLAGGYSRRADWRDATVLRASTGARLAAREVRRLEPGDRIIVPFRERRTFLERIQTTQAVVGIVSGALLTVASISAIFR